jgi:hypothetical protein
METVKDLVRFFPLFASPDHPEVETVDGDAMQKVWHLISPDNPIPSNKLQHMIDVVV